jgi:glycosyltransferase 2 family protein
MASPAEHEGHAAAAQFALRRASFDGRQPLLPAAVKKIVVLTAKLVVTLALLYFAASRANLEFVAQRLQRLQAAWFLASVVALAVQAVLAGWRWRIILDRCGAQIPVARAVRYTLISLFFSQVLPSTVGGDAARIWLVARDGAGWSTAIYSVAIDRMAGVLVLALIVIAGIPESFAVIGDPLARAGLLALGLAAAAIPCLFIAFGARHWQALQRHAMLRHINAAANLAYRLFTSASSAFWIVSLSILIQGLTIISAWLAAKSIAAPFDLIYAALLVPPVLLVMTAPISIAGWGVRESAMVVAFSYAGLPQSDGLLVAALFGLSTFALGIVGGVIWLMGGRTRMK